MAWDDAQVRAGLIAVIALLGPGLLLELYWYMPRSHAMLTLPFEEYIAWRTAHFDKPYRTLSVLAALALLLLGNAVTLFGLWKVLFASETEAAVVSAAYPLLGVGSLLLSSGTVTLIPYFRRADEAALGPKFAARQLIAAISLAAAGGFLLILSVVPTPVG